MLPSPSLRQKAVTAIRRGTTKPTGKVIFSGIQPTGVPHLGNYLGALRQWVKLQNEVEPEDRLFFSIVDLHAITVPQKPESLRIWRTEMFAALLAVGLDPSKSTIFFQSQVPMHAELMWILSCRASMGYLSRMTQWKSKAKLGNFASSLDTPAPLGLFSYPVLQAADILLYGTTHVPVGEDQAQHLEFTRNLAASFNSQHGPILIEPQTLISPAKRVMSLTDPTQKMSKSDPNANSRILITNSTESIRQKINGALTDSEDGISYDRERRPGWSNLIEIAHHLREEGDERSCEELARDLNGMGSKGEAKRCIANLIDAHLAPIRHRHRGLMLKRPHDEMEEMAAEGKRRAEEAARSAMDAVHRAVGTSFLSVKESRSPTSEPTADQQ